MKKVILFSLFFTLFFTGMYGKGMTREQYIAKYSHLAVKKMKEYGIPASITLAQGLLESANGNSTLARKGKNHFGIKCHNNWKGARIYIDDDKRNECFRKYKSVEDSYNDHSEFLKNGTRYSFLFSYSPRDYKSWAKGLKKAGYATNPKYASLLIKIIEEHELFLFDRGKKVPKQLGESQSEQTYDRVSAADVRRNNGIPYVMAKQGDNFESIARTFGISEEELVAYNEVPYGQEIYTGMVLYLKAKRNKAVRGYEKHKVKLGENLWFISQMYGVKVEKLLYYNRFGVGYRVKEGEILYLRKRKKKI